jgi:hypothetical protein
MPGQIILPGVIQSPDPSQRPTRMCECEGMSVSSPKGRIGSPVSTIGTSSCRCDTPVVSPVQPVDLF